MGTISKRDIVFLGEHLIESMIYVLTFYVRGGCRPRGEEMHSCLIFPFITGGLFPKSPIYFFCLLFTRCCEVCAFMCLVLCSSATGCEAIYFFLLCSWLPLKRHVQEKEEKHILPISCSHIIQTRVLDRRRKGQPLLVAFRGVQ